MLEHLPVSHHTNTQLTHPQVLRILNRNMMSWRGVTEIRTAPKLTSHPSAGSDRSVGTDGNGANHTIYAQAPDREANNFNITFPDGRQGGVVNKNPSGSLMGGQAGRGASGTQHEGTGQSGVVNRNPAVSTMGGQTGHGASGTQHEGMGQGGGYGAGHPVLGDRKRSNPF